MGEPDENIGGQFTIVTVNENSEGVIPSEKEYPIVVTLGGVERVGANVNEPPDYVIQGDINPVTPVKVAVVHP